MAWQGCISRRRTEREDRARRSRRCPTRGQRAISCEQSPMRQRCMTLATGVTHVARVGRMARHRWSTRFGRSVGAGRDEKKSRTGVGSMSAAMARPICAARSEDAAGGPCQAKAPHQRTWTRQTGLSVLPRRTRGSEDRCQSGGLSAREERRVPANGATADLRVASPSISPFVPLPSSPSFVLQLHVRLPRLSDAPWSWNRRRETERPDSLL